MSTWCAAGTRCAFGGDFRRLQQNLLANTESNGVFGFNGTHTGDGLADLLLGYISGFSQGNRDANEIRQTVFSFYTQDTYHISRRLTMKILGLRWEPDAFPYDRKGSSHAVFAGRLQRGNSQSEISQRARRSQSFQEIQVAIQGTVWCAHTGQRHLAAGWPALRSARRPKAGDPRRLWLDV